MPHLRWNYPHTRRHDALAIVPAFNEAEAIAGTVRDLLENADGVDVLVVDDHSDDDTSACARAAGATVVRLPMNLGIGGAVQTGFRLAERAGYEFAFQFDGDGQHPANAVKDLIAPLRAGEADAVIGSRFIENEGYQSEAIRRVAIRGFERLSFLASGVHITDTTSGFRAYNRRTIAFLAEHYPSDYPEVEAITLLARSGYRIREIPVVMRERQGGESSITWARSVYYLFKVSLASLMARIKRRVGTAPLPE